MNPDLVEMGYVLMGEEVVVEVARAGSGVEGPVEPFAARAVEQHLNGMHLELADGARARRRRSGAASRR
ncbi:hypothetical protein ACLESD_13000 [Pyxidicoccus sp. 3LFB2]